MYSGRDGISLVSRIAASALAAHGFSVEVNSLCDLDEKPCDGVSFWSARNSPYKFMAKVAGAAFGSTHFSHVLVMHIHLGVSALPLAWRGSQLSIFLHGIEAWKPLRFRERAALKTSARLMANSDETVRRFRAVNGRFHDLPVRVCPLGIPPLNEVVPGTPPNSRRFALIVGRLDEGYKGHDELLELWPDVLNRVPGFSLVIAGGGPDLQRLREKATALNLSETVIFAGSVDDATLLGLYRDCEFFVMPSVNEGFGLVYLEAMRTKKACIGAPGAATAIIQDGRTGIVVDPACKPKLLEALLRLISQPERTAEMGLLGYERFLNHFTAEKFGEALIAALR
jgi:glycosyltransferase involved in cell wall biosynthesis